MTQGRINRRETARALATAAVALALLGTAPALRAQETPPAPAAPSAETDPAAAPAPEAAPESATDRDAAPAAEPAAAETEPGPTDAPAAEAADAPQAPAAPAAKRPLTVVSWGGVYSKSQKEAIHRPFTRATGIEISDKVYAGTLDEIRAQRAGEEVAWDVVDVDPADAAAGCAEGLFEKLSFVLPAAPDGTAASEDFLPGTIQPCAIGSVAWSMVIARPAAAPDAPADTLLPETLEDFFDLETFPGGRGLRRTPMANLEWALLADGVAPGAVYDVLRTKVGVDRALAKLDTIRESIVWWEDAGVPADLLASGQVVMSSAYNAPVFNDIAVRGEPVELIWDHQIWDIDLWAILSGTPRREAALEFVRFATSTEPLARQTRWLPYGPVRRSSVALVGDFLLAEVDMAPFLPTAPENLEGALRNDALFWREEGPALVERFNDWLAR